VTKNFTSPVQGGGKGEMAKKENVLGTGELGPRSLYTINSRGRRAPNPALLPYWGGGERKRNESLFLKASINGRRGKGSGARDGRSDWFFRPQGKRQGLVWGP